MRQAVCSVSVRNPSVSTMRATSSAIDAFDLIGGFSLHSLHRSDGTCPFLVLWSLYAGSRSRLGPRFPGMVLGRTPKLAQAGFLQ